MRPLRELMHVAGARWAIEEAFRTATGQVGLDQYQSDATTAGVDTSRGDAGPCLPHRHHRRGRRRKGAPRTVEELIPLTVPEVGRLLAGLIWQHNKPLIPSSTGHPGCDYARPAPGDATTPPKAPPT